MSIPLDIAGQSFGRLIAQEKTRNEVGRVVWRCVCECGNVGFYQSSHLTKGNIVSCGCLKRERLLAGNTPGLKAREELDGRRFGRLLVKCFAFTKRKCAHWECICDCGEIRYVSSNKLTSGHTTSCGCQRADSLVRHGRARRNNGDLTYHIWTSLRQRCENPKDRKFMDYGGRGIYVCQRWSVFENFLADMGEKPLGMSIDRVDNSGPYSPDNCRWAIQKTQARNQRRNLMLTIDGDSACAAAWAERLNVDYWRLRNAIRRFGNDQNKVLTYIGMLPN
jgi:hypothetical protein